MHGIVLLQLSKFAKSHLTPGAWTEVRREAGAPEVFNASAIYADAALEALLEGVSRRTNLSREALLEAFGEFIVPSLLDIYVALVPERWGLFDLLEHTESLIHRVVRLRDATATPPQLHIERTGPVELAIRYDSSRNMCWFGKGIITGLATHYDQPVHITDALCMVNGDPYCDMRISEL